MILTPLLLLSFSLSIQLAEIDWVVKDTILPLAGSSAEAFEWGARHPFGDVGGDYQPDTLVGGLWIPPPGSGMQGIFHLGLSTTLQTTQGFSSSIFRHGGGHDWALLQTPYGLRFLGFGSTSVRGSALLAVSVPDGEVVGKVVAPTNLPGGVPDPTFMEILAPSGDTNGDGFDDFFWGTTLSVGPGYAYFGLGDGASLTSRWTHAEIGSALPSVTWEANPMPDLTGDGVPDFLVGTARFVGIGMFEHSWFLLSGADGAIVWREDAGGPIAEGAMIGKDLNGDGFPEAALLEADSLRLISANNGVDIWKTPWTVLSQSLNPGWELTQISLGEQTFSKGLMATDSTKIVRPFLQTELSTMAVSMDFAIFDTSDGALLGTASAPQDLSPWDAAITLNGSVLMSQFPWPYGDFDNDGLMEYSVLARDKANSPAWAVALGMSNYSQRLVILGQRTLFTEETHDVLAPTPVTFNLICPSGPGKDFVVLLSTAFSERHGLNIGQWKTYLGASSALDLTLTSRALSGTLDAEGQGSTYAMVPPNPNLIGQTLYSRGLILNPAGSADPLWSMTSLGQTLLQ